MSLGKLTTHLIDFLQVGYVELKQAIGAPAPISRRPVQTKHFNDSVSQDTPACAYGRGNARGQAQGGQTGRADDVVEISSDFAFEPSMDDDKVRIRFELTEFCCFV